jgi:NADH-quinone oxidoreductase subunit F
MVMDDTVCMVHRPSWSASSTTNRAAVHAPPRGNGLAQEGAARLEYGGASPADVDLLLNIAGNMMGNTICALADAAAMPARALVTKYRAEFEEHAALGRCSLRPAGEEPRAHAHG